MPTWKSKIYNLFAEQDQNDLQQEAKNNVINPTTTTGAATNDLANPKMSGKMSPKAKKRLISWTIALIIVGGGLSLILYYSLRPTARHINEVYKIEKLAGNEKGYSLTTKTTGETTSIYTAGIASPYAYKLSSGSVESFQVFVPQTNGLPYTFRLNLGPQVGNANFWYSLAGLEVPLLSNTTTPPTQSQQDFYKDLLLVATINWSTTPAQINWFSLIISLLPFLLLIGIFALSFKAMKMQTGGQDGIFSMGKSGAQIAKSNVKFNDVAGIKEEKEELSEIVDYLKHPQKYAAMGARTPKGVILYGPPGTGKTLLAKAVAGEAEVPFFQISGSQFEDMLVGVGAKRVRDLFSKARKAAPAIIFIDEIDSVASKRGKNEFGGGLADQTINQLLAEMDGFNTSTGIVIIAATNRLDVLDDAILRPGRFDRHIQINLPDIKEREAILLIHSRNKNISKKVSMYDIARRTPGFSGAQLENVLNEATLLAVRNSQTTITTIDIDEAIDRVIAGPAKKSRVITPHERKLIAYHEAGHAIVGLYTAGTDVVQKITIIPRGSAAGYTMQTPEGVEKTIQSKEDLLSMVRMTLGGRACEEVVFGKDQITTGASNDLYKVTNIVRAMVMQLGMSDIGMTQFFPSEGLINPYQQQKLYSDNKARIIDEKIEMIIQQQFTKAKSIISGNRKELDLIVEALLILETILKEDIDYIHKHKKLPANAIEAKKIAAKEEAKIHPEHDIAKTAAPKKTLAAKKVTTKTTTKAKAKPNKSKDTKLKN